jgi:hypothetical protein
MPLHPGWKIAGLSPQDWGLHTSPHGSKIACLTLQEEDCMPHVAEWQNCMPVSAGWMKCMPRPQGRTLLASPPRMEDCRSLLAGLWTCTCTSSRGRKIACLTSQEEDCMLKSRKWQLASCLCWCEGRGVNERSSTSEGLVFVNILILRRRAIQHGVLMQGKNKNCPLSPPRERGRTVLPATPLEVPASRNPQRK